MPELLAAITPATRLLVVNAPNNPTGWTLTAQEQQTILAHCRATGTWILADEVYERLYYEPTANGCAPSFLDIAEPEDHLVVVHSFSKSFLVGPAKFTQPPKPTCSQRFSSPPSPLQAL
jgi:aspartate/methionine/tyrosine aminotransferase